MRARVELIAWCVMGSFGVNAIGCGSGHDGSAPVSRDTDPPEVQLGERLFLETRFAEFFFAHSGGDVNAALPVGDPVMDATVTTGPSLTGPFRGQSMNCRACHLVDELGTEPRGGVRTYDDFGRRSPVPAREDGLAVTPRNSPLLVGVTGSHEVPFVLHFDGEFPSTPALVAGTLTGRNFGWLPGEHAIAVHHIAEVIRNDDGTGALAGEFAGSLPYRVAFLGTDRSIPKAVRIPNAYRIDVSTATDAQVLDAIAALIAAYVDSLRFSIDTEGGHDGSPYDVFLRKNGLPRKPAAGESNADYTDRLRTLIAGLSSPVFVSPADGRFQLHAQPFQFGASELQGLKVFFSVPAEPMGASVGNCVSCHPAPEFTDFRMHNTGATQIEYDMVHGTGAFAALDVPSLTARNASFDAYLPPSPAHPTASGRFRSAPAAGHPGLTDLGVWNIVGNPDAPAPQAALMQLLCAQLRLDARSCDAATVLPLTIGLFKTPTLRDLGQSDPYLHTGHMDGVEDVLAFYVQVSGLAKQGRLRNGASELIDMTIGADDLAPLAAFLRALNEDYS
jgi:cytochrome c peroxidase